MQRKYRYYFLKNVLFYETHNIINKFGDVLRYAFEQNFII